MSCVTWSWYYNSFKNPNFISGHRKGPRPSQTQHTDVNRTHSRTYRFIYIDSRTDTVLLYTSCTDGLYFCVHYCTTWHYLNIHLWCTHYAWISCTAVQLYYSPVSVRLYCQLVCPRKITLMNRVDQSQLSLDLPASLWLVH